MAATVVGSSYNMAHDRLTGARTAVAIFQMPLRWFTAYLTPFTEQAWPVAARRYMQLSIWEKMYRHLLSSGPGDPQLYRRTTYTVASIA